MTVSELLAGLVVILIGALGTWITNSLIPYIKSRTTLSQQDSINFWVSTAVNAAEQMFVGSGQGELKLKYVNEFLIGKGIDLDSAEAKAIIESAVLKLKNGVL